MSQKPACSTRVTSRTVKMDCYTENPCLEIQSIIIIITQVILITNFVLLLRLITKYLLQLN